MKEQQHAGSGFYIGVTNIVLAATGLLLHIFGFIVAATILCRKRGINAVLSRRKYIIVVAVTLADILLCVVEGTISLCYVLFNVRLHRSYGLGEDSPYREGFFDRSSTTESDDRTLRSYPQFPINHTLITTMLLTFRSIALFVYVSTMFLIFLNIILVVSLKIRYKLMITEKRLALIMMLGWLFGIIAGLVLHFALDMQKPAVVTPKTTTIIRLVLYLVSLLAITTIYLYTKPRSRGITGRQQKTLGLRLGYLIIGSYIFSYIIPNIGIYVVLLLELEASLRIIIIRSFRLALFLGLIADAAIYLFVDRGMRMEVLLITRRSIPWFAKKKRCVPRN